MSKSNLLIVSCIAAIPAGFLSYELVRAFLGYAENMPGLFMAVAGIALACSATLTLTPFGILIFTPKDDAAPAAAGQSADDIAVVDDEFVDEVEEAEIEEGEETDSFGDVIPEDFDGEEAAAGDDFSDDFDEFDLDSEGDDAGDLFDGDDDDLTDLELDLDEEK